MAVYTLANWYNYELAISAELLAYGQKLANMHKHGQKPSFDKEVKFKLLQAFVKIAKEYLDERDDTDNNFFTIDEFEDIQQHINRITNTYNWLKME